MPHNISYKQKITEDVWKFLPILNGEELSANTPLIKYGANSLDIVDLIIKLEDKYHVKFQLQNLTTQNITILTIAKMLKAKPTQQKRIPQESDILDWGLSGEQAMMR